MPFENEGFDLRAVRGDEVLLVEVKGHRGASVVADISEPQVKECERCSAPGATERWQLWNIEHLAVDDQHNVTTTVVDRIPWVALRANSYRLDLRQCEPVSP